MTETTSSGGFGCFPAVLVGVLIGLFALVGLRQGPATAAVEPDALQAQAAPSVPTDVVDGKQSMTVIEKVEAQVNGSTITLQVSGYHPDGCKFPAQVEQKREGDTVMVTIFRIVPKGLMCTMDLNPYSDTITLDGTFEDGTYTVNVNGTTIEVRV